MDKGLRMGTVGGVARQQKRVPHVSWLAAAVVTVAVMVTACQPKDNTRTGDVAPVES